MAHLYVYMRYKFVSSFSDRRDWSCLCWSHANMFWPYLLTITSVVCVIVCLLVCSDAFDLKEPHHIALPPCFACSTPSNLTQGKSVKSSGYRWLNVVLTLLGCQCMLCLQTFASLISCFMSSKCYFYVIYIN